ncbi:hypothetical protein WJX82_002214 [Trebouxia sp. C0006]
MPWPVRETDVWQRTSIQSLPSTALGKRWCRRHPTSCILVRHPRRQLTMGLPSAHKVEVHNPAAGSSHQAQESQQVHAGSHCSQEYCC